MQELKKILQESKELAFKLKGEGRKEDYALMEKLIAMADLFVETPYGTYYPEKSCDVDYPGIYISIQHHSGYNEALALVEYRVEDNEIKTLAWQGDEEDYVSSMTNYNEPIEKNIQSVRETIERGYF